MKCSPTLRHERKGLRMALKATHDGNHVRALLSVPERAFQKHPACPRPKKWGSTLRPESKGPEPKGGEVLSSFRCLSERRGDLRPAGLVLKEEDKPRSDRSVIR